MGGIRGRDRTLVAIAVAIVVLLGAVPALAAPGDGSVKLADTSQKHTLEKGVAIKVEAPRRWKVRTQARIRHSSAGAKSALISKRAERRVKPGTRRLRLKLNARGRKRIARCTDQTVIVQIRVVGSKHRRDRNLSFRDSGTIELDSDACATEEPPPDTTNRVYAFSPAGDERHTNGTPRDYAVTGLGADSVRLAVFACDNVAAAGDEFRFEGGATAERGSPGAGIASIEGSAEPGTPGQTAPRSAADGRIDFSVSGADGCGVAVAYEDGDGDGSLDLDSGGIPAERYGVGSEVSFEAQGVAVTNASRCDFLDTSDCMYPFPSNYLTTADSSTATGRRINFNLLSTPSNRLGVPIDPTEYNRADGFSPGSMLITKVPGLDSQEALEQTGAVPIDDLGQWDDPDQPVVVIDADSGERWPVWTEVDANPDDPADRTVLIRPQRNFLEGHRYIVGLRNLRDAAGDPIPAGRAFQLYRDSIVTGDGAIEARRPAMEDILDRLSDAGVERSELNIAWDFTIATSDSIAGRMLAIRDDAFASLGDTNLADLTVQGSSPAFAITGTEDFTVAEDANIGRRVEGTITVPCYLATPLCLPGGQFLLNPSTGMPTRIPGNTAPVSFICNIPHSALDAGGEPARPSLYGHGLLGSADEVDGGNVKAMAGEHNMIECATDWAGFSTKDAASIALILQDVNNFPKLADGSQQGFLNFLFLGRALIHAAGLGTDPAFQNAAGESVIDARRLFYDGNSQGGILGGSLAAIAPDFDRAVLGVPGMNYSTLLRRSVDFDGYATGAIFGPDTELGLYDNYPNELQRPLLLSLLQMLWDRAEANGYAEHMTSDPLPNTPPHQILMQAAFGDHQVSNVTAEVEARTIGAATNSPLDPGRFPGIDPLFDIPLIDSYPYDGSALVYYDSGSPNPPAVNVPPFEGADPHSHPRNDPAAREQKSAFLQIGGKVIDVCNGGPCYANGYAGPP